MAVKKTTIDLAIDDVCEATKVFVSNTLFVDEVDKQKKLEESCKNFLFVLGYKVVDPISIGINYKIVNINDLIEYFYLLLFTKHPNKINIYRNKNKDRGIARRFVDSRMLVNNLNEKETLLECSQIIKTVIKYEDKFNFEFPVSFSIFGQDALGWITEKAIGILNFYEGKWGEKNRIENLDEAIKEHDQDNEQIIVDDLNSMLKGVECG